MRSLVVLAFVTFVLLWGAASWLGGWLYGCEAPACQLWAEGPLVFASVGALTLTALVAFVLRLRRMV